MINYNIQRTLIVDDKPNGFHEEEVVGNLLVADFILYSYCCNQSKYGEEHIEIIPCFWNGGKAFLKHWTWFPQGQYSAEGEGEEILSFEDGVKLLLEQGAFEWCFSREEKKKD